MISKRGCHFVSTCLCIAWAFSLGMTKPPAVTEDSKNALCARGPEALFLGVPIFGIEMRGLRYRLNDTTNPAAAKRLRLTAVSIVDGVIVPAQEIGAMETSFRVSTGCRLGCGASAASGARLTEGSLWELASFETADGVVVLAAPSEMVLEMACDPSSASKTVRVVQDSAYRQDLFLRLIARFRKAGKQQEEIYKMDYWIRDQMKLVLEKLPPENSSEEVR